MLHLAPEGYLSKLSEAWKMHSLGAEINEVQKGTHTFKKKKEKRYIKGKFTGYRKRLQWMCWKM